MAVNRSALPFPVLPGKTEEDAKRFTKYVEAHPEEYRESRQRVGITLERAYLQTTPMGMFVTAYAEGRSSAPEVIAAYAQSNLDIDRYFREFTHEVHGFEWASAAQLPPPELLGAFVDTDVTETRRGMAFCAPLIAEQMDRGREWAKETYASPGMRESRRALGINKEIVTVLQSPNGPVAGIYLEGDDPFEGNRGFAASSNQFDVDFKSMLKQLFPPFVNFDEPVPGVSEIFDSEKLPVRA